jgi:aminoglycoside phosphotransferase (APT) family kinase protein
VRLPATAQETIRIAMQLCRFLAWEGAGRVHADLVGTDVPTDVTQIDAAWLTRALSSSMPDAVVASVKVTEQTHGTTTRARLRLEYATGAGPDTLFVKIAPRSLWHRMHFAIMDMNQIEAWSYAHLANGPDVVAPRAYHIEVDARTERAVFLLEDLDASKVTFGADLESLSVEQASEVVDALADLHGTYWNRPARLPPAVRSHHEAAMVALLWAGLGKGLERADALVPPSMRDRGRLLREYRQLQKLDRTGPMTLLHGDPHIGNLYFLPTGRAGFHDWQSVYWGSWAHDFGHMVMSALSIRDRRAAERDLLHEYLARLGQRNVEPPPFDEAWVRYRRQSAYGLPGWIALLGYGDYNADDIARERIRRYVAASRDLDVDREGARL